MVPRLVKIHGTFFLVLDLAFFEMVDSNSESFCKILFIVGKMYLSLQQYSTRCAAGTVFMEIELLSQVNEEQPCCLGLVGFPRWERYYKAVAKSPSGGVIESNIHRF